MQKDSIDWAAIVADPQFIALQRQKSRFLFGLLLFALCFFFCLPLATAYFRPLLNTQLFGAINLAILFALAQFLVAWGVAFIYVKRANTEFDLRAKSLIQTHQADKK